MGGRRVNREVAENDYGKAFPVGRRQLVLFPAWWPAGVVITFAPGTLGDTLVGDAEALVADLARPRSRSRARVVQAGCNRP